MKHYPLSAIPKFEAKSQIRTNGVHALPAAAPETVLIATVGTSRMGPMHGSFSRQKIEGAPWSIEKSARVRLEDTCVHIQASGVYVVSLELEASLPNVPVFRQPCDVEVGLACRDEHSASGQPLVRLLYGPGTTRSRANGTGVYYFKRGDRVTLVAKTTCGVFLPRLNVNHGRLQLYRLFSDPKEVSAPSGITQSQKPIFA